MTLIAVGTSICGHYKRIGGEYTRIEVILGIPGGARSADSRHLLFAIDGHDGDADDNRDSDRTLSLRQMLN